LSEQPGNTLEAERSIREIASVRAVDDVSTKLRNEPTKETRPEVSRVGASFNQLQELRDRADGALVSVERPIVERAPCGIPSNHAGWRELRLHALRLPV
jgi:hypothetical protein